MIDNKIKVLAIDIGFDRIGLAILDKDNNNKDRLIHSECFETNRKDSISKRINSVTNHIESLINKYQPNTVISESIFVFKNHKTVIDVAGVRGVVLFLVGKYNLDFHEYTPIQIKSAITGDGRADKKQVLFMVKNTLKDFIYKDNMLDDEIDAIAIGLTGLAYFRNFW